MSIFIGPRIFLGLFFCLLISSCSDKPLPLITLTGKTMGTTYMVKFLQGKSELDREEVHQKIEEVLKDINQKMSTYIKTSEISKINKEKDLSWRPVSKDLYEVIQASKDLHQFTGGAFDITVGPLVNLWGFGPTGERKVPTPSEIEKAKSISGDKHLVLDEKERRLKKKVSGLYLDLSAIAKGYGVDRVAQVLESFKVQNYMVEVGGEIKARGKKRNSPWRVAIESPTKFERGVHKILEFNQDLSLATSGTYRNFFKEKGKYFSHTIDLWSGKPIDHKLASVSILDPRSCMKADALATALMAMGPTKAIEFAEKNKVPAYFIYLAPGGKEFVEKASTAFKNLIPDEEG